ncbi:MAG: hypothetical protein A2045_03660 [Rhodocyclales bacterium GWA2_65_20]|nr:MAG: hypothetical protein A2045_03660 [Rhodocyclales bacterium GWA2_65_20]
MSAPAALHFELPGIEVDGETNSYIRIVITPRRHALFRVTHALLALTGDAQMSKMLTPLVAGLFAASAFAATPAR